MIRNLFNKVLGKSERTDSQVTACDAQKDTHQYKFSATLAPNTPLRYLRRHGELSSVIPDQEQAMDNQFYVWTPVSTEKYAFLSEGRTISSSVGSIDPDGGDFLPFLIELRTIIEQETPNESDYLIAFEKSKSILDLGNSSLISADDYIKALFHSSHDRLMSFILREQGSPSFNGLQIQHLAHLSSIGYSTITDMINAPDSVLLDLEGIGPSRLKKIQQNKMA